MDNEVLSLSDILTDSNSDESSNEDIDQKCETSDTVIKVRESVSKSKCNGLKSRDLLLDLRNLNEINDFQNAEEKYEKLSEVVEEPEDIPEVTTDLNHELQTPSNCKEIFEKSSPALEERISSLSKVISSLREELKREISLWRKEREEFQILQEKSDLIALEEATAAARAAAEAYAAESPLSDDLDRLQYNCCNFIAAGEILDVNPEQTLSELTILEYEKKLAKYQDALALAQAEKRYNMRRQLAANTYRQKLMEVERLCDEELEKIKQNANSLQPLKQMVSQWYISDHCGGDAEDKPTTLLDYGYKSTPQFSSKKEYSRSNLFCGVSNIGNKVDAEVNMTPEIFVAKFHNVDETDFSMSKGMNSRIETDYERYNIASGIANSTVSLKWELSNYNLPTSLGNP